MKYFVKNEHGELTYGSIHELRAMFEQGLVDPGDDVRPEDSSTWRKAAAIPELREFAKARADGGNFWFLVVAIVCLSGSLGVLVGSHMGILPRVAIAAALMVPVLGMSQRAFTKVMKRSDR